jgi:hypothetical protein
MVATDDESAAASDLGARCVVRPVGGGPEVQLRTSEVHPCNPSGHRPDNTQLLYLNEPCVIENIAHRYEELVLPAAYSPPAPPPPPRIPSLPPFRRPHHRAGDIHVDLPHPRGGQPLRDGPPAALHPHPRQPPHPGALAPPLFTLSCSPPLPPPPTPPSPQPPPPPPLRTLPARPPVLPVATRPSPSSCPSPPHSPPLPSCCTPLLHTLTHTLTHPHTHPTHPHTPSRPPSIPLQVDLYTDALAATLPALTLRELPPHAFSIAELAYRGLQRNRESQVHLYTSTPLHLYRLQPKAATQSTQPSPYDQPPHLLEAATLQPAPRTQAVPNPHPNAGRP